MINRPFKENLCLTAGGAGHSDYHRAGQSVSHLGPAAGRVPSCRLLYPALRRQRFITGGIVADWGLVWKQPAEHA